MGTGSDVLVGISVFVTVEVGIEVFVGSGVELGVAVLVGVRDGVLVIVAVLVGVKVGNLVGMIGLGDLVIKGVELAVDVKVALGVSVGCIRRLILMNEYPNP